MSEEIKTKPQSELNAADFPSIPKEQIADINAAINVEREKASLPPLAPVVPPPVKTPAEISAEKEAAANAEKKVAAEKAKAEFKAIVDKYTALAGKHFVKISSDDNRLVKVVKYIGVHTISGGIRAHLLEVEIKGIASWHPVASQFLIDYTEVETPKTETSNVI